ncbi:MAG: hypothetical protein JNK60_21865, partial [Acidobacteria bacterium]|nr:hypothetical protein [Acidobacteriota bacterium]
DPSLAWAFRIPRTGLASLGERLGVPGARLFEIYSRTEAGRVSSVRLLGDGKLRVVSGFAFRMTALDLWGASTVRSTAFSTAETRSDYLLSGRGFGHGAGLCQRGAMARARRGETCEAILSHYYGNTLLGNLDALPVKM